MSGVRISLGSPAQLETEKFRAFLLEKIEPRVECREPRDGIGFADEYKALRIAESDYFGSVSGHDKGNKIETAGFHASKSAKVNAPVIEEYPLTFECEVEKMIPEGEDFYVVGKIKGILADESILTHGRPDPDKLHALAFDGVNRTYLEVKDKAGMAWAEGRKFIKR